MLRSTCRIGGAALAVALGARLSLRLPGAAVPVTGQTLGVLLAGGLLGPGHGFLAMLVYLGAGACRLPVFAPGSRGLQALRGASGGYLAAFPLAAALTGLIYKPMSRRPGDSLAAGQPVQSAGDNWIAGRWWNDWLRAVLATSLGHAVILASGVAWLACRPDLNAHTALRRGLVPLLPGAVAKSLLAAVILVQATNYHYVPRTHHP